MRDNELNWNDYLRSTELFTNGGAWSNEFVDALKWADRNRPDVADSFYRSIDNCREEEAAMNAILDAYRASEGLAEATLTESPESDSEAVTDAVSAPNHYLQGPKHSECGKIIECIDVSETFSGNLAQAIQYIWRHEHKGNPSEDLRKAANFCIREANRLEGKASWE